MRGASAASDDPVDGCALSRSPRCRSPSRSGPRERGPRRCGRRRPGSRWRHGRGRGRTSPVSPARCRRGVQDRVPVPTRIRHRSGHRRRRGRLSPLRRRARESTSSVARSSERRRRPTRSTESFTSAVGHAICAGKTAVLVDDGLATGATMIAAVRWARRKDARRVVVAVPVAAAQSARALRQEADEVICPHEERRFGAVGSGTTASLRSRPTRSLPCCSSSRARLPLRRSGTSPTEA